MGRGEETTAVLRRRPDRANSVDDPSSWKLARRRGNRLPHWQPLRIAPGPEHPARVEEGRTCPAVDCAVDPASAEQRRVRGIHHGVDRGVAEVTPFDDERRARPWTIVIHTSPVDHRTTVPHMEAVSGEDPLQTERLLLRPWAEDDAEDHLAIYGSWDVARWLGAQPRAVATVAESKERIQRWESRRVDPFGLWAIVPRQPREAAKPRPIGTALLVPLSDADGLPVEETEIGWHLHPDHWGRGLATEAATCLLDRAWRWGRPEVWAVVRPDNYRSIAVAERLGMQAQGRTSQWYGIELAAFRSLNPTITAGRSTT